MGRKSNYFRHTFTAHNDDKIQELLCMKNGLKYLGFYWVILELYGEKYSSQDSPDLMQKMHIRTIANATGLRTDSTRTCLKVVTELELIDTVFSKSDFTFVQLGIPNFLKYFGKYEKTGAVKSPNKRKEKKRKEKKSNTEILVKEEKHKDEIDRVITHLNKVTNKAYKLSTASHRSKIRARLNSGRTVDELIAVIDLMASKWKGTRYEQYLTTKTLFCEENFENYVQNINTLVDVEASLRNLIPDNLEDYLNEDKS